MQNRIVRVISKKGFDAHTEPLFKNLMILKLEDIYFASREIYVFFQKYLKFIDYNTRSSNRFYIPLCRTNMRKFSAFY